MKFRRRFSARRRNPRLARWVGRIIPLIFVGIGLYLLQDAITFAGVAQEAEGEVLSISTRTTRNSDTGETSISYTPQIRFTAADGATHVGPTHISSGNYDYSIGARVAILYNPADPTEVRIDSVWSLYLLPVIFTAVGSLFFVLFIWFDRKEPAEDAAEPPHDQGPTHEPPQRHEPKADNSEKGRYENRAPTVRR